MIRIKAFFFDQGILFSFAAVALKQYFIGLFKSKVDFISPYSRFDLPFFFSPLSIYRCDQYPSGGAGHVFWGSADEEDEAEHHGCSQICLWHVPDRLRPVHALLRHELRERQDSRGDGCLQQVSLQRRLCSDRFQR